MATLTLKFKSHYHSYFSVGGAGTSDEPCFISKTAGVYTHLQPIKFRVKQDKRVRPEMEGKKGGKVGAWRYVSNGSLLYFRSWQKQKQSYLWRAASWPLEEVSIGLKLLPEHELSPVLNDQGVWGQVPHCLEDFLVLLDLTLANTVTHEINTALSVLRAIKLLPLLWTGVFGCLLLPPRGVWKRQGGCYRLDSCHHLAL